MTSGTFATLSREEVASSILGTSDAPRNVGFKSALEQTLDDRFQITDEIARGGMATIYKARDLQAEGMLVALKIPHPIFGSGLGSWSMFQREEEIGCQLDHPNIVKFMHLPPNKHRRYLAMEYVPGTTLGERLRAEGLLPEVEALAIARQVVAALQHMHERGFVHYDLKPDNILLQPDGSLRLIDLGLSHAVERRSSWVGAMPAIGSKGYIAPEQIQRKRGRKSVDIYAVGAMLYELLTGKHPFPDDDPFVIGSARLVGDPPAPGDLNPNISRPVEEIVLRALCRDPSRRYASMAAMKSDLDCPESVVVTGLRDHLQPVTRWRRGARLARYIAFTVIVPVALQVVVFLLLWKNLLHRH
jgi:serine/threonine-protein kinase